MNEAEYLPLFECTRGDTVESIHYGGIAVVDSYGKLIASYGKPDAISFLRSTAKPFQALPFIESGGAQAYDLKPAEIALLCASHAGTDEHVSIVRGIQDKTGVKEEQLLCGVHPPFHKPTAQALQQREEAPTPNRHNCSGKHTGMLAYARLEGWSLTDYIDPQHPVQKRIVNTVAEMANLSPDRIALGIDGCSAPNYALPLYNTALAFARLCDPQGMSTKRAEACLAITSAMRAHPEMVDGPGRFDTQLMHVARGRIVAKGGAEGYYGLGLWTDAGISGAPAIGIAIKIADGDGKKRARASVVLETLRQLGVLSGDQLARLAKFGPHLPVLTWRQIQVGETRPCFQLAEF